MTIPKFTDDEVSGIGIGPEHGIAKSRFNNIIDVLNYLETLAKDYSPEPAGFERDVRNFYSASSGELAFNDSERTLTISPASGQQNYWFYTSGVKYTYAYNNSIQIPDVSGQYMIYFDAEGELKYAYDFVGDAIYNYTTVAYIYWDADEKMSTVFADERHGYRMSTSTHVHHHNSFGTAYYKGLDVTDIVTDGSGDDNISLQFGFTAGEIADEDIRVAISQHSSPANIPIYYKSGVNGIWKFKTPDDYPVIYNGTAGYTGINPPYNHYSGGEWILESAATNNYIVMLYFATTDFRYPIIGMQSQSEYSTLGQARDGVLVELNKLAKDGMSFIEFVACYGMILQISSTYGNVPKARFRTLEDGGDYFDLRKYRGGLVII